MAKRRSQPEPEPQTQVVGVVREWEPHNRDSLTKIHAAIDSWGRASEPIPTRDSAEVQAAVDRVTKRVKSRNVTVTETVTEWVDADGPVEVVETAAAGRPGRQKAAAPATASSGKRKPRILGFFGPKSQKRAQDEALAERAAGQVAASGSAPGASDGGLNPQCSALTEDGAQCRNSARGDAKYCASHKGWQPPTAKGLAKRIEGDAWDPSDHVSDAASVRSADTRPRVRKAKDTKVAVRKPAAKKGRRKKR